MKHKRNVALWKSMAVSATAFLLGALGTWLVGGLANEAIEKFTDRAPLAADLIVVGSLGGHVLPMSRAELLAEGVPEDMTFSEYTHAVSGWGGGHTVIDVNLYGLADYPVVIEDIRVTSVRCRPPGEGAYTFLSEEGGGNLVGLEMLFALSGSTESVAGVPDPSRETGEEAKEMDWEFPRQVSQAEADRFKLGVSAPNGQMCQFRVTIDYRADGQDRQLVLEDDQGSAFRLADVKVADEILTVDEFYKNAA